MWNLFISEVVSLVRQKNIFLWTLLFPIILSSIFFMMFSTTGTEGQLEPLDTIVVQDDLYRENETFQKAIESASAGSSQGSSASSSSGAVLNVTMKASRDEAREALLQEANSEKPYVGAVALSAEGDPELIVVSDSNSDAWASDNSSQTILALICERYQHSKALVTEIALSNPRALGDEDLVDHIGDTEGTTEQVTVTNSEPNEWVRYYYALLGMAALFAAQIAGIAVCRMQPNLSPLGARRAVSGTPKIKSLLAVLLATWVITFACLSIVAAYMRIVGGISFGGRGAWVIAALAAASLFSTGFGTFIGALPRISEGAKAGIITAIGCFSSLFAGLYGQPTMELADKVTAAFPLVNYINPASVITQAFYSINYYDDFSRIGVYIACLIVGAMIFLALAIVFVRRQRYASI